MADIGQEHSRITENLNVNVGNTFRDLCTNLVVEQQVVSDLLLAPSGLLDSGCTMCATRTITQTGLNVLNWVGGSGYVLTKYLPHLILEHFSVLELHCVYSLHGIYIWEVPIVPCRTCRVCGQTSFERYETFLYENVERCRLPHKVFGRLCALGGNLSIQQDAATLQQQDLLF